MNKISRTPQLLQSLLCLLTLSHRLTPICGDVTFGSMPTDCSLKRTGDMMDLMDTIDCEGAGYSEIPYTSIPCSAKRINFANNNFTRITRDSFRGLQQLEEIILSGNMISYVEAEAFAGLPNLKDVNMGNNRLMEIDERPFWRGQYQSLTFSVDGNPWYCNEDLKETVEALIGKVSFIGLRCRGGFIRGVRGTIVGRELEDVKDRIENDFESWEIALIVSGSCGFAVIVALIGYGVAMYKMNYANDGEEYEMEETRENNGRYLNATSSNSPGSRPESPEPGTALDSSYNDRKIHINSEDYYNQDNSDNENNGAAAASFSRPPSSRPAPPVQYKSQTSPSPTLQTGDRPSGAIQVPRFRTESPRSHSSAHNIPPSHVQSPLNTSPPPRPPPVSRQFRGLEEANENEEEINV